MQCQHSMEKGRASCSTWRNCPEVTDAFDRVRNVNDPLDLHDDAIESIEAFIIFMHTNKRDEEDINHVRKILFCPKGRAIEHIPPTKAALI